MGAAGPGPDGKRRAMVGAYVLVVWLCVHLASIYNKYISPIYFSRLCSVYTSCTVRTSYESRI